MLYCPGLGLEWHICSMNWPRHVLSFGMKIAKQHQTSPNILKHSLRSTITHKRITEPNFTISNYFRQFLFCDGQTKLFLELIGLGKKCEQWITEPLGSTLPKVFGNYIR